MTEDQGKTGLCQKQNSFLLKTRVKMSEFNRNLASLCFSR